MAWAAGIFPLGGAGNFVDTVGAGAASILHKVRLNFIYRLEAISPTVTPPKRTFKVVNRLRGLDLDGNNTGRARDFTVARLGSDQDLNPTDFVARRAGHQYEITIAYPAALGDETDLSEIMDSDRDDIIRALQLPSSFGGITGSATAATGLESRRRAEDRLTDDGPVWLQTYRYNCVIREVL